MPAVREPETHGREIYAPRESFVADVDGVRMNFGPHTLVREGHAVLRNYRHMFEPVRVQYEVEEATSVPGEKRAR